MRRLLSLITIGTLWLSVHCADASDRDRTLVRVDVSGQREGTILKLLHLRPDVTGFNRSNNTIDILVAADEVARFKTIGLPVDILIDDVDVYEQQLRRQDYLGHFHTYDQMLQEMQQVASDYPAIAALFDIGDTWEKTQGIANRDIWALKISDTVDIEEPQEAEVLYMGCHHAREIITPEIVLHFMHYLIDGYGVDPEVTALVDNRQLWLVPMVNPDGHQHVFDGDLWWRKNRRRNGDGSYGVDLNRNYGYMWGYDDIGSSPNPRGETYRGAAPFSEPEVQAIRDLVEAHIFIISLSYHSYGNLLLLPWGYIAENTPDHETFVAIGDSATAFNGYFAGNTLMGAIYVTNGDTDDWLYGEQTTKHKVFGFTPEVGGDIDGFHPDTSRIVPLIEENLWPNLYVARVAEDYAPRPEIHHQPLNDTENVSGPYDLFVEISASVYPLDELSPKVYFNTTGYPPFDSISLSASGDSGIFVGQIPGQGEDVTISYFFSACDTIPRTAYEPAGAPESLYAFHVGPDAIFPVISFSPEIHRSVHTMPVHLQAHVTDNLGIGEVRLVYRVNDSPLDSTAMSVQQQDLYVGQIEWDGPAAGDFVEYRIVALDRSTRSNMTTYPESGSFFLLLIESLSFDFELTAGGFSTEGGSNWEWGSPSSGPERAYSGENVWATRLGGPYGDLSDSKLDSPPFDLSEYAAATFSFFHWYRTESGYGRVLDGGNIKGSVNGGPFEVIFSEGGYDDIILPTEGNLLVGQPVFGGSSGIGDFWHQETVDLSPYVGQTVVLRFHFGSNATGTDPGWYIDDVSLRYAFSRVPTFWKTTALPDTDDTSGPYIVYSSIFDDGNIGTALLCYRKNESTSFDSLDMTEVIPYLYRGQLPGQLPGTVIDYYVRAVDDSGNVVTDPPGAPEDTYRFTILQDTDVQPTEASAQNGPEAFRLFQNYPNPFNPTTDIQYQITEHGSSTRTTLRIFNMLGQEVITLVDEIQPAGVYSVRWNGTDTLNRELPTGIYLYRLESGSFRAVNRMLLIK